MGGSAKQGRGIISGINVTPLVDVTLVLLIIFMVTAKLVVTPAVPLDLPKASQGEEVQVVFSVLLPVDGSILVNGASVPDHETLSERARAALADDPALRAVIQADGDISHRRVIAALDALKRAGVTRIAFGALPDLPAGGQ
ncbi:MAG TPA: biopolymer transporter ExbD [Polyangiales bacterium]|nr:biopolymer transporter ExbD [Polyangiales bacterium]